MDSASKANKQHFDSARPRLAVDIGGTFTDVAIEVDGAYLTSKVLTTAENPVLGVLRDHRLAQSIDFANTKEHRRDQYRSATRYPS